MSAALGYDFHTSFFMLRLLTSFVRIWNESDAKGLELYGLMLIFQPIDNKKFVSIFSFIANNG